MLALEFLTGKRDSSSTTTGTVLASLVFPNTDNNASGSSPPTSAKSDLAKEIIEWVFVGIVIILICTFFMRKLFFEPRSRRTTGTDSSDQSNFDDASAWARETEAAYVLGLSHPYPGVLYPAAAVVRARNDQPDTRGFGIAMVETRHADVSRGLGLGFDGTNVHMRGGSKDFLPVYEAAGGPPAYRFGATTGERRSRE
ncbi:hypothetical protein C8F01DRAFT_158484 [Mycena amicta]|nr:hypothetical protein C8F01DRAFT_158484 [Mycena amicta]